MTDARVAELTARLEKAERTIAARDRRIARLVAALEEAKEQGYVTQAEREPPIVLSADRRAEPVTDAIRVKPLVWVGNPRQSDMWRCYSLVGDYFVIGDGWSYRDNAGGSCNETGGRAGAEEHYRSRIRSALEPVSVQEAARVLLDSDGYLSDCAIHAACYCAEIDETRAIVALREGLRALAADKKE